MKTVVYIVIMCFLLKIVTSEVTIQPMNLLGAPLSPCDRVGFHERNPALADPKYPQTGYFRDGKCTASSMDIGAHFVCSILPFLKPYVGPGAKRHIIDASVDVNPAPFWESRPSLPAGHGVRERRAVRRLLYIVTLVKRMKPSNNAYSLISAVVIPICNRFEIRSH